MTRSERTSSLKIQQFNNSQINYSLVYRGSDSREDTDTYSRYFVSIVRVENLLELLLFITIEPAEEEPRWISKAQFGLRKLYCKNKTAVEAHSLPLLTCFI